MRIAGSALANLFDRYIAALLCGFSVSIRDFEDPLKVYASAACHH
jgi:hypothetical protein